MCGVLYGQAAQGWGQFNSAAQFRFRFGNWNWKLLELKMELELKTLELELKTRIDFFLQLLLQH